MALDEAGVRFVVEGLSAYLRDIEKTNDATEDVGTKTAKAATESGTAWGKIGKAAGLAAAAITVAVTVIGGAMVKLAGSFDDAYDSIQVKTGATGVVLDGLKESIKRVMTTIPADGGDIAKAMGAIYQKTGATGAPLETLTTQILELSRITGTDLDTNIEAVLDATQRWGVSAGGAAPFLDELFRISQESGVPVADLATALADNKAVLDGFGYTLPEAATLIGALGLSGLDAGEAMGGLELALRNMVKNGVEDPKAELEAYFDRIKNAKTDAEATGIATEIFGRQAVGMADAIRNGSFDVDAFTAAVGENKNGIQDTAEQTNDWKEKLDILKNKILVEIEPALMAVFDAVTKGVEEAGPKIEQFRAWFDENLAPAIRDVADRIRSDVIPAIQKLAEWIGDELIPLAGEMVERFKVDVVPVLEDVAEWINSRVVPAVKDLADWFTNHLVPAVQGIVDGFRKDVLPAIDELWSRIQEDLQPAIKDLVESFNQNVKPALKAIGEGLQKVAEWAVEHAVPAMKKIVEGAQRLWQVVEPILEGMIGILGKIGEAFGGVVRVVQALTEGDWSAAWTAAKDVLSSIIDAALIYIKSLGTAFFEAAKALWDGVVAAVDAVAGDQIRAVSEFVNTTIIEPIRSFVDVVKDAGEFLFGADGLLGGMIAKIAEFASLGQDIVNAVIGGLSAAWSQVLSWISDHLPTPSDLLPDWLGLGGIELTIPVTPILLTPSNWLEEWWQKELEKQDQERAREEMQRIWEEWLKSHPIELSFDNLPITPVLPKNRDELTPDTMPNKPFKPGGELSFDNQPGKPKMPGGSTDKSKPSLTDISDPARFLELVMNAIATIEALADADIAPVSKAKLLRLAQGLRSIIVEFGNAMKGIRPEVAEAAAEIATFLDPILRAISEGAKALEQLAGDGAMPGYPRILQVITAIQYATATAISKLSSLDTSKLEKTAATAAFIADIMADIASAARDLGTLNNSTSGGGGIPGGGTTGGGGGNVDRLAEILAGFTSSIPRAGQRFEGAPGGVSYVVSATYVNPQTPGSIALDLQEIAMRASAA